MRPMKESVEQRKPAAIVAVFAKKMLLLRYFLILFLVDQAKDVNEEHQVEKEDHLGA